MPRLSSQPRQRLGAEARRPAILTAARAAFGSTRFVDVSVAAIAADAGASEALVYRYFDGKAGLYAQVLRAGYQELLDHQLAADAALPAGSSTRDRVRRSLEVYLDHVQASAVAWSAPFMFVGNEPDAALEVRRDARTDYVRRLSELLGVSPWPRHSYALRGYFGFLDGVCLHWVEQGCPDADRHPLMDATLGALEGALGDWRV